MASHKKHAQPTTFALPGKSQMVKIVATVAAVGLLATGGIVSHNLYATAEKSPAKQVTAYSVTDSIEASRGNAREALSGDTSYVTVKIDPLKSFNNEYAYENSVTCPFFSYRSGANFSDSPLW